MSWKLIEHQALTSSVASVTLGNGGTIPQTYKTLKLVVSARCTADAVDNSLTFNGATTNFSDRWLYGDGAVAGSTTSTKIDFLQVRSTYTANVFSNSEITIPNYAGSTNKPVSVDTVTENNATTSYLLLDAGLWANTAAITSITITPFTGSYAANSTFTLYGLK